MIIKESGKSATENSICYSCPNCGDKGVNVFYQVKNVPVHSVLLFSSRDMAINYPKGDIELGFCKSCGFISNTVFDPSAHEYFSQYESSQAFSSTFNSFSKNLAELLIKRHNLWHRDIIEIGCGQGEFLKLLCKLGNNIGIGFDPAYNESRSSNGEYGDITFVKDFYSEKYKNFKADFICCKMTLEHIHNTTDFIRTVRRAIGNNNTAVFFQIPEASRILDETAFWDIYYEHCSYFSPVSLAKLFQNNGFDVRDLWTGYDDQYLMIESVPGNGEICIDIDHDEQLYQLGKKVGDFTKNYPGKIEEWKNKLRDLSDKRLKTVVWGSSSKGVAFLTTLGFGCDQIEYVVDINPFRQGSFMAGTGQEIVSPEFLKHYKPDLVVVMNPIYNQEIENRLKDLGLSPEMISV